MLVMLLHWFGVSSIITSFFLISRGQDSLLKVVIIRYASHLDNSLLSLKNVCYVVLLFFIMYNHSYVLNFSPPVMKAILLTEILWIILLPQCHWSGWFNFILPSFFSNLSDHHTIGSRMLCSKYLCLFYYHWNWIYHGLMVVFGLRHV